MPRRSSLAPIALGLLLVALAAYAVLAVLGVRNGAGQHAALVVVEVGAIVLCAARTALVTEERPAWACVTAYLVLWAAADLGWAFHFDAQAEPPYPNWTDGFYLTSYLLAYAGLSLLLRARLTRFETALWLDGLLGALTVAAVCAAVAFGPVFPMPEGSPTTVAVTLSYPALDLLLLCGVATGCALTGWRPGRAWGGIALSLLCTAVADVIFSYQQSAGTYVAGGVIDVLWPAAALALAWAAWQPPRRLRVDASTPLAAVALPALFAGVALMLLVVDLFERLALPATLLAAAALSVAGVRAVLALGDNLRLLAAMRTEVLTDGLTALPNRRRLLADLDAPSATPRTLALFDLDGFKAYNDTFGHLAGDALLVRLGRAVEGALGARGTAYRLGGDEFCVVVPFAAAHDDAVLRQAAAALTEEGEGFHIGVSYGSVVLPREAPTTEAALQHADARMYAHKARRRGSTRRDARDLLMTILKEREPGLEQHVGEVAGLATAVARRLGITGESLDEIARGAELHDIGKLAVPDSVLHKPGPLDDDEWAIMRQHTVIGERMLSSSPALRPVARLVRASHERWDGGGYPDGQAAEAIPLGARIIAACDALHAMMERRPYATPRTREEAIAELRRCAGTQFDPEVVEALAAVATAMPMLLTA